MNVLKRLTIPDYQPVQALLLLSSLSGVLHCTVIDAVNHITVATAETPDVMLANVYRQHEDVSLRNLALTLPESVIISKLIKLYKYLDGNHCLLL